MTRTIFINKFDDIKEFITEIEKIDAPVDAARGRYVIDAKSLMGMFSLDLSKPIDVTIHSDNQELVGKFVNICNKYA